MCFVAVVEPLAPNKVELPIVCKNCVFLLCKNQTLALTSEYANLPKDFWLRRFGTWKVNNRNWAYLFSWWVWKPTTQKDKASSISKLLTTSLGPSSVSWFCWICIPLWSNLMVLAALLKTHAETRYASGPTDPYLKHQLYVSPLLPSNLPKKSSSSFLVRDINIMCPIIYHGLQRMFEALPPNLDLLNLCTYKLMHYKDRKSKKVEESHEGKARSIKSSSLWAYCTAREPLLAHCTSVTPAPREQAYPEACVIGFICEAINPAVCTREMRRERPLESDSELRCFILYQDVMEGEHIQKRIFSVFLRSRQKNNSSPSLKMNQLAQAIWKILRHKHVYAR